MTPGRLWLWRSAAALAFAADLFLHLPVTHVFDGLAAQLGFFRYDRLLLHVFEGLGAVTLGVVIAWRRRPWPLIVATALLLAVAAAARWLMEVAAIENIHYPQYALLAFLLARSGLSLEASWLGATGLGVIDEAYQFLVLREGTPSYLDWNDIVFNAIGAGFGVVVVLLLSPWRPERRCSWRTATTLAALPVLAALALAPPHLSPFFNVTPIGIRYHVLSATEGLLVIALLWFGTRLLISRVGQVSAAGG